MAGTGGPRRGAVAAAARAANGFAAARGARWLQGPCPSPPAPGRGAGARGGHSTRTDGGAPVLPAGGKGLLRPAGTTACGSFFTSAVEGAEGNTLFELRDYN